MRPYAVCRCGQCGHTFRTLEDEADSHPCPRCGYSPWVTEEEETDRGEHQ